MILLAFVSSEHYLKLTSHDFIKPAKTQDKPSSHTRKLTSFAHNKSGDKHAHLRHQVFAKEYAFGAKELMSLESQSWCHRRRHASGSRTGSSKSQWCVNGHRRKTPYPLADRLEASIQGEGCPMGILGESCPHRLVRPLWYKLTTMTSQEFDTGHPEL